MKKVFMKVLSGTFAAIAGFFLVGGVAVLNGGK